MRFALRRVDERCVRILNDGIRRTIAEKERREPVGGQGRRAGGLPCGRDGRTQRNTYGQVRVHVWSCARLVGKVRIWGGMTATCPEHVGAPATRTGRVGHAAAPATAVGCCGGGGGGGGGRGQKRTEPTAAQAAKELWQDCRAGTDVGSRGGCVGSLGSVRGWCGMLSGVASVGNQLATCWHRGLAFGWQKGRGSSARGQERVTTADWAVSIVFRCGSARG